MDMPNINSKKMPKRRTHPKFALILHQRYPHVADRTWSLLTAHPLPEFLFQGADKQHVCLNHDGTENHKTEDSWCCMLRKLQQRCAIAALSPDKLRVRLPTVRLPGHQQLEYDEHVKNSAAGKLTNEIAIKRFVWLAKKVRGNAEKTTAYRDVVSTACHWYVKGLDKHWVKLAETDKAIANDEACAAGRKTARLFADQHAGAADDLSEADFGPPAKRVKSSRK